MSELVPGGLDDVDDRVTGWCRNPDGCTEPDCACLALRRAASCGVVRRAALVGGALAALAVLTACDQPFFPPPDRPLGRVVQTRTEPASQGRVRVVATVRGDDGREWEVRLDRDTRCTPSPAEPPPPTAVYPGCAELEP